MNIKNKKIFKRIGAGLMLGLSLLGFGASTRGGQTTQVPKKLKNFRQKGKEQLSAQSNKLLTMIENEAKAATAENQTEQQRQALQQQIERNNFSRLNFGQKVFRYSVLAVWTVAAGLFFTSLVFNAPMTLGKKILSALPGNPHTAVLKMDLADESKDSDKMIVNLSLDSDGYSVQFIRAMITFDPSELDFAGYQLAENDYDDVKVNLAKDDKSGNESLEVLLRTKEDKVFEDERIAQLNFETIKGGEIAKVDFYQPDSLVISDIEGSESNILGQVSGTKFLTLEPKVKIKVNCFAFTDQNPADSSSWQELIKGRLMRGKNSYWQDIDNESSFVCGQKDGKVYLLLVQLGEENLKVIDKASISLQKQNGETDKTNGKNISNWEENSINFSVFEFSPSKAMADAENFFAEFSGDNYAVKWPPAEGFGRMELGN